MVTFWNLKWCFQLISISALGLLLEGHELEALDLSLALFSQPEFGKGQRCFHSLNARHPDEGSSLTTVWLHTEDANGLSAEPLLLARPNLLWRIWEHFVWGHNNTVTLSHTILFSASSLWTPFQRNRWVLVRTLAPVHGGQRDWRKRQTTPAW